MRTIKVVCGIIYQDNRIFICRRNADKSLGGYWEFPGGKVEPGEGETDCLVRELQEELGMEVVVGDHFKTVDHSYDETTIELSAYVCTFVSATYELIDHDAYEWVDKGALLEYKLAPADVPIAQELVGLL